MEPKKKLNWGLIFDRFFRRTVFLRPLPDKSFEAIDITGNVEGYLAEESGATVIDPSCIIRVRGLRRVEYIVIKQFNSSTLMNLFDSDSITLQPPPVSVTIPEQSVHNPNAKFTLPPLSVKCPGCEKEFETESKDLEIVVPDVTVPSKIISVAVPQVIASIPSSSNITEKEMGDLLNLSESAGELKAERDPNVAKKQNWMLMMGAAAVIIGIIIFWKMNSGGA